MTKTAISCCTWTERGETSYLCSLYRNIWPESTHFCGRKFRWSLYDISWMGLGDTWQESNMQGIFLSWMKVSLFFNLCLLFRLIFLIYKILCPPCFISKWWHNTLWHHWRILRHRMFLYFHQSPPGSNAAISHTKLGYCYGQLLNSQTSCNCGPCWSEVNFLSPIPDICWHPHWYLEVCAVNSCRPIHPIATQLSWLFCDEIPSLPQWRICLPCNDGAVWYQDFLHPSWSNLSDYAGRCIWMV